MPGVGIEPTCLAAHELKSCVYTSSTIPARQTISLYLHQNNIAKIVINQANQKRSPQIWEGFLKLKYLYQCGRRGLWVWRCPPEAGKNTGGI